MAERRPAGYPKLKNYKPSTFMLPTSHYDKAKADRAVKFIENLCHKCRALHVWHTFCTNMAKKGMNPKNLQYIMGHASIEVTLDYYTHWSEDDAKVELERMEKLG